MPIIIRAFPSFPVLQPDGVTFVDTDYATLAFVDDVAVQYAQVNVPKTEVTGFDVGDYLVFSAASDLGFTVPTDPQQMITP